MVQPVGIPDDPVVQLVIVEGLVNVPDVDTPSSQKNVQRTAEISVARQVILFKLLQL